MAPIVIHSEQKTRYRFASTPLYCCRSRAGATPIGEIQSMFSNTSDELNVIQREREYPVMRAFGNALMDDEEADGRVRTRSDAFRELS